MTLSFVRPATAPLSRRVLLALLLAGAALAIAVAPALNGALLVLAFFAAALWRGANVLVVAPLAAGVIALIAAPAAPLPYFEANFANPAGEFVARFLLLFLAGAVFGRLMAESGCAAGIARAVVARVPRRLAPVAVAFVCATLTMAGVGVFVIAFSMYPIARAVFVRLALPLALIPATIALGAFTATMTAIPGAPSLTNIIAAAALGTTGFAAPGIGLAAGAAIFAAGAAWLTIRASRAREVQVRPTRRSIAPLCRGGWRCCPCSRPLQPTRR